MGNDENLSEISNRNSKLNNYEVEMIAGSSSEMANSSSEMSTNSPKRETFGGGPRTSSPTSPHQVRDNGSTHGSHLSQPDETSSLTEKPESTQDEMMTVM